MAEINAGYLTQMRKHIAKAIEDAAKGVSAQSKAQQGQKSPVTVNLAINVKVDSAGKEQTQTERVGERMAERTVADEKRQGNVWLTQEAAKGGFYGGTTYAQQMRGRFISAGYGMHGGGLLQNIEHYSGIVGDGGGMMGRIGQGVQYAAQFAAITAAVIQFILPQIHELFKKVFPDKDAERAAKAVTALPRKIELEFMMNNPFSSAAAKAQARHEYELLLKGINTPSHYLEDAIKNIQQTLVEAQSKIVGVERGVRAAMDAAITAALMGEKPTAQSLINEGLAAGAHAEWKTRLAIAQEQAIISRLGGGVADAVVDGVREAFGWAKPR